MKALSISIAIGLLLLYFVDAALKIQLFTLEMLIHSAVRFFAGFVILGICAFYQHIFKLNYAIALVIVIVFVDDVLDYVRNIDSFHFQEALHSVYMLIWGTISGYVFSNAIKTKSVD